MKMQKLIAAMLLGGLLLGIHALPAFAQATGVISAQVDRTSLNSDESLLLTVTIDASDGQPSLLVLPDLDGFSVVSSTDGTQIMLINGELSVYATHEYWLRPTLVGDLVIEPISVTINGQVYSTEPITIQVSQGSGQIQPMPSPNSPTFPTIPNIPGLPSIPGFPSLPFLQQQPPQVQSPPTKAADPGELPKELNGRDFFVEAEIDNPSPYQGEQVTYTFRLYQGADLWVQDAQYIPPSFSGFWHEEQPDEGEYAIQAAGRTYHVIQIQTVLFPTVSGEVTIDPTTVTIPSGIFTAGQTLATQPISLQVKALPSDSPPGFKGAVGQFNLQAEVDSAETQVNGTVTLYVTLQGQGNIPTLADLTWPEVPQWRAFNSQAQVDKQLMNGKLSGTQRYEWMLVPIEAGLHTLPPIEFSYFDPNLQTYQTIHTQPISVNVAPDPNAAGGVYSISNSSNGSLTEASEMSLRPVKPAPETWRPVKNKLIDQTAYWLLWGIPFLLIAGQIGWQSWQKRKDKNPATRRNHQAARRAYQALNQARKNPSSADNQAAGILINYLEDKLNHPVSGLTQASLSSLLSQHGVPDDIVSRVEVLLSLCEMSRFAYNNSRHIQQDLLKETKNLVEALDKVL